MCAYLVQTLQAKCPASLSDRGQILLRGEILTRLCLPLLFSPPPRPLCFHQTTKSVKFREITQLLSHSVFRLGYPGVTHIRFR